MKKAHKVFLSRAFSVSLRDQIIFSPLTSVEHEPSTEEHRKKSAQASDRILYQNLLHSVETFMRSNDFADVPIVCDDGSVTLAHKVILAFL